MILNYFPKTDALEKERTRRLSDYGIDERRFQNILFRTLDRLFPDDELIMLMQSTRWREEPDLMALDKHGNLFIFELKVWESTQENLLQVLRYGQILGDSNYEKLNSWFQKHSGNVVTLKKAFEEKFGRELTPENCNQKQVFVVMTNGMDYKTREAIKYWRSCNLDVRPWIYRIYDGVNQSMKIEIAPFRVDDNPYEDIAEGYYILNTNFRNSSQDHEDMLQKGKCAAYYSPWKHKIERLNKSDVVFLYQSGVGIVAFGDASGKLQISDYHGLDKDEEYSMRLNNFHLVAPPLTASEIKDLAMTDYRFLSTMFGIDHEAGKKIRSVLEGRKQ